MDLKHVCKFCKKSFPCGRSLGGHIRSHLIHNTTTTKNNSTDAPNEDPEFLKSGSPGYELRGNPRKTNKGADMLNSSPSSLSTGSETEHELAPIKSCQKWNPARRASLIGGNNSQPSVSEVAEPEQEEVAIAMCLIMLSRDVGIRGGISSNNNDEISDQILLLQANSTKRRTGREKSQGKDSVPGLASNANNTNKKSKNLEFSSSGNLQNGSKMKGVEVSANGFASNDQGNKPCDRMNCISEASNLAGESKKAEAKASGQLQNGLKMKELEVSGNGFASIDQSNKPPQSKRKIVDDNKKKKKLGSEAAGHVNNGSKKKEIEVFEDGSALNDQKSNNLESNVGETTMNLELGYTNSHNKRSKFECTTCNKVFNSYQALGGHRASHKKLLEVKSSPVSKLEGNDISNVENLPFTLTNPPVKDHDQQLVAEIGIGSSSSSPASKKLVQKHECPICFRVFPSGQALGGHKRSHLLAANGNNITTHEISLVDKSSNPETRDLLDLNLPPAAAEEETTTTIATTSSSNSVELIKPYWWVESSNHEPILGLISN